MKVDPEFHYDTAQISAIGRRDVQEDAVAGYFPEGSGLGCVVLADGMGGHSAGDVASRIVVREFFEELARYADAPGVLEQNVGDILRDAMERANGQVARHATDKPDRQGMGSTLVALVIVRNRLYWISVGDSPLYLLRGDRMSRLNQEHSMARHLDRMVIDGLISQVEADRNPDRFCLTSGLVGLDVPEIDCRDRPIELLDGDIVIVASDGLLTIDEQRIAGLVYDYRDRSSTDISSRLLQGIRDVDDPDQDNVTVCVVKIRKLAEVAALPSPPPPMQATVRRTFLRKRTTTQFHVKRKGSGVTRSFSVSSETNR